MGYPNKKTSHYSREWCLQYLTRWTMQTHDPTNEIQDISGIDENEQAIKDTASAIRTDIPIVEDATITLQGTAVTSSPQTFTLNQSGNKTITINDDSGTDNQTLSFTNPNLSISGGNSVNLGVLNNSGLDLQAVLDNGNSANGVGINIVDAPIHVEKKNFTVNYGTYTGIWRRGYMVTNSDESDKYGMFGSYNSDAYEYLKFGGYLTNINTNMYLFRNGNVLIGTTTDNGAKLQVEGNITAKEIKLTTGATDGYYLRTDADGNGTWQAVTASSVYKRYT